MVFQLALDCPLISALAIERDRSSVVMFTACVAVVNGVGNGVANRVVSRVLMQVCFRRLIYTVGGNFDADGLGSVGNLSSNGVFRSKWVSMVIVVVEAGRFISVIKDGASVAVSAAHVCVVER